MKYKVISLTQPYASLCVTKHPNGNHALKSWETRSYATTHRGLLLIHASLRYGAMELRLMESEHYKRYKDIIEAGYEYLAGDEFHLPLGCIIGMVTVNSIISTQHWKREMKHRNLRTGRYNERMEEEIVFGDYGPFRFAWQLSNPIKFDVPIPMKGRLSVTDQDMPEAFEPYKQ